MLLRRLHAAIYSLTLPLLANTQANNLGTAATFGVLGASTVTNTGLSFIQGDLGVSPGSAITGFPPGAYSGTAHIGDAVALQANADATIAYATASSLPATADLTGQDLAGLTLPAGVYRFATTASLTGDVVLDAQGDPNALFVFQIGSGLTVASGSTVSLINGAQACNVIWQVGSSATLGPAAQFRGIILALASVTAQTGANVDGSLIGLTGAVTLDTNQVNVVDTCGTSPTSPVSTLSVSTTDPTQPATVPNTGTDGATATETETIVVTVSGSTTVPSAGPPPATQIDSATIPGTAVIPPSPSGTPPVTSSAVIQTPSIPPPGISELTTLLTGGSTSPSLVVIVTIGTPGMTDLISTVGTSMFISGSTTIVSTSILSTTITLDSTTISSTSTITTLTFTSPSSTFTSTGPTSTGSIGTETISTGSISTGSISTGSIGTGSISTVSSGTVSTSFGYSTTFFSTSLTASSTLTSSCANSTTSATASTSYTTITTTTCESWLTTYYEESCTCHRTQTMSTTLFYTTVVPCTTEPTVYHSTKTPCRTCSSAPVPTASTALPTEGDRSRVGEGMTGPTHVVVSAGVRYRLPDLLFVVFVGLIWWLW